MVGGNGDRHASVAQRLHRWQLGVAQKVVSTGQQQRHAAVLLHGLDAAVRQVFQVVAAQGPVTRCQGRAALVTELLGMQFDGQAQGLRGLEDAFGLGRCEADVFAESVHRVDQACRVLRGQPLAGVVDVGVGAAAVLGRQRVGRQRGGANGDGQVASDAPRHAQAACFVFGAQAIAGLDFQRGDALGHQHPGALGGTGVEAVVAGGACGRHRAANAATGPSDFFVAGALQAQLEFGGAVAAVDQVGVGVDQAGRDQCTLQVVFCVGLQGRRQLAVRAQPDDAVALCEQRAVVHPAPSATGGHGGQLGVAPQDGGGGWRAH